MSSMDLREEIIAWALKKKKEIEDREYWQINPANFGTLRTLDEVLTFVHYELVQISASMPKEKET